MAATRRAPPLEIYHDPNASFGSHSGDEVEIALLNALRPLSDASNRQKMQLNSTTTSLPGSSPIKTDSSPVRPLSAHGFGDITIPPPSQPNFGTDSPSKNEHYYSSYQDEIPMPDKAPFAQFPSVPPYGKENHYDSAAFTPLPQMPYGDFDYGYKGPMKRTLMHSAPLKDRSGVKKQKIDKDEPFELPDPNEMPLVTDDGSKPPHSYAELIGMSILRAPNRRLTLAQIYKWISDNFCFYKTVETGWQNSIRHNLSLNKNFVKQERPKDDPGKGNYWAIKPGEERPYMLGKKNPVRRITNPDGSQYMHGLPHEMGGFRPSSAPAIGQFTLAPNPVKKEESKAIDSAEFPVEADFSSDGTIPASDPALQEDDRNDTTTMLPPPHHFRSSPPPVDLGSSPPPMLNDAARKSTPPPVPRFHPTSRSGGRRQKFAGLNDSGYWSSIESSAARGAAHQLTSEADIRRSRIKKGRAEEELARIRSSSFDSPTKGKPQFKSAASFVSSSPLKDDNPLTPAVVFKRPTKPPASVSPNTNLRNHRNRMKALLGSPAKPFSPLPEVNSWSPAFNLAEDGSVGLTPFKSPYAPHHKTQPWKPHHDTPGTSSFYNAAFDVFIDAPDEDIVARGSPEKRSARRPSLARAATSAGILADITGTAKSNNVLAAGPSSSSGSAFSFSPFCAKATALRSPARLGLALASPLKHTHEAPPSSFPDHDLSWLDLGLGAENAAPPSTHNAHNAHNAHDSADHFFGLEIPSDGSEEAIDLFQDFGKIGQQAALPSASARMPVADRANGSPVKRGANANANANANVNMGPPARPVRPGLARSCSSRW
ncbi:hypothetical protein LTR08_006077 [Meristemomyces frigidus]|nr:hypothetical protein LTR08_006077 [Meristemomyces frigidus]